MIWRWGSVVVTITRSVRGGVSIDAVLGGGEKVLVAIAEGDGNVDRMMLMMKRRCWNGLLV